MKKVGYVIVGIICLVVGVIVGMTVLAMCAAAKAADIQRDIDDSCHGCFGASFGDCGDCPKKGGDSDVQK